MSNNNYFTKLYPQSTYRTDKPTEEIGSKINTTFPTIAHISLEKENQIKKKVK